MRGKRRQALPLTLILALLLALTVPGMALAEGGTSNPPPAKTTVDNSKLLPVAPTQLTMTLTRSAGTAMAKAVLTDAAGHPIRKGDVTFIRKTTFGQLTLGTDTTGFDGEASVKFKVYPGQNVQVTAQYGGGPGLAASQAQAKVSLPPAPVDRSLGIYSQVPNPWYIVILVVVLGGIWSAYGYALSLVRRIRRAGKASAAEEAEAEPSTAD